MCPTLPYLLVLLPVGDRADLGIHPVAEVIPHHGRERSSKCSLLKKQSGLVGHEVRQSFGRRTGCMYVRTKCARRREMASASVDAVREVHIMCLVMHFGHVLWLLAYTASLMRA